MRKVRDHNGSTGLRGSTQSHFPRCPVHGRAGPFNFRPAWGGSDRGGLIPVAGGHTRRRDRGFAGASGARSWTWTRGSRTHPRSIGPRTTDRGYARSASPLPSNSGWERQVVDTCMRLLISHERFTPASHGARCLSVGRSTAGRRSHRNPSLSPLTSPPKTIPLCHWRLRRPFPTAFATAPGLRPKRCKHE